MKRILHVVGGLGVGGAETWLTNLLAVMNREHYHFEFLVYHGAAQSYRASVESLGARVLSCAGPHQPFRHALGLLRILRSGRYDVVHAHTYCSSGLTLALAALAGVPIRIFHSHTAQDEHGAGIWRTCYFHLSRLLIQRFATQGIAVSEEAAKPLFPKNWPEHPNRWRISPPGIRVTSFEGVTVREAVRRELAISPAATMVVHVGRFAPVKNHDFLVAIAQRFLESSPNAVFVLVGDGPLRPPIERLVKALGLTSRFRFLGIRSDVSRILHAADVFVMPSAYEGFPLAYLEAQSAGLPCVVSDRITVSADLSGQQILRRSLHDASTVWAAALREASGMPRGRRIDSAFSKVSIEQSMESLVECYR